MDIILKHPKQPILRLRDDFFNVGKNIIKNGLLGKFKNIMHNWVA